MLCILVLISLYPHMLYYYFRIKVILFLFFLLFTLYNYCVCHLSYYHGTETDCSFMNLVKTVNNIISWIISFLHFICLFMTLRTKAISYGSNNITRDMPVMLKLVCMKVKMKNYNLSGLISTILIIFCLLDSYINFSSI